MTWIPQTNSQLISVSRETAPGSATEDYDRPATPGVPIWQGRIDAYVQRKIVSTFNQDAELRRAMDVTFYVTMDLPVTLEPGDTITYTAGNPTSPVTISARIQNITDPAYMPQLPDYYKCALEEIEAP